MVLLNLLTAKPEYLDVPARKLKPKLEMDQIDGLIKSLGMDVDNKVGCYLPFYEIKLKNGETKTVDALSYSLKI